MTTPSPALSLESLHDDALLSTLEVAALFRIPAARLRNLRWKRQGARAIRLGSSVRYRLRDVREWLEAQAEAAPASKTQPE